MVLHPADRGHDVVGTSGPAIFRCQPIIDREPGKALLRERLEQRRDKTLLGSPDESAAMHQDAGRERPIPFGNVRIQGQGRLANFGEGNVLVQARGLSLLGTKTASKNTAKKATAE